MRKHGQLTKLHVTATISERPFVAVRNLTERLKLSAVLKCRFIVGEAGVFEAGSTRPMYCLTMKRKSKKDVQFRQVNSKLQSKVIQSGPVVFGNSFTE